MSKGDQLVSSLPSFKRLERTNRLERAEDRHQKAQQAVDDLDNHTTAVGVVVPTDGGQPLPIFWHQDGAVFVSTHALEDTLAKADGNDASALLTALFKHHAEGCSDVTITAGRLPDVGSALLIDPVGETVSLIRPSQSPEPVAVYSIQEWHSIGDSDGEGVLVHGPDGWTDQQREILKGRDEANKRWEKMQDLLQPGYSAAWEEARVAEAEMFNARKAIKTAPRRT